VQKLTQALKSIKDLDNTFDLIPKWSRTLPSLIYFSWDINRDHPSIKVLDHMGIKSKVLPGPLTDLSAWVGFCTSSPQQGVKYQKPTQALKSVKGPGNTFDLSPKWSRTLPSLIYFYGILKYPMQNILRTAKFLTTWGLGQRYCPGLLLTEVPVWVSVPQAHSRVSNINFNICVKGPGNTFDRSSKWSRTLPSLIYFSWDI
jgi:hypothetical protein